MSSYIGVYVGKEPTVKVWRGEEGQALSVVFQFEGVRVQVYPEENVEVFVGLLETVLGELTKPTKSGTIEV